MQVPVFYPEKPDGVWGMKIVGNDGHTRSYQSTNLTIRNNELRDILHYAERRGHNPDTVYYCRDRLDNHYVPAKEYTYCFDYDYIANRILVVCYPYRDNWFFKFGYFDKSGRLKFKGYQINSGLDLRTSSFYSIREYIWQKEPRGRSMEIFVSDSMNGEIYPAEENPRMFEF